MRFLFAWQHVGPASRADRRRRPAARSSARSTASSWRRRAWERAVLPARLDGYDAGDARHAVPDRRGRLGAAVGAVADRCGGRSDDRRRRRSRCSCASTRDAWQTLRARPARSAAPQIAQPDRATPARARVLDAASHARRVVRPRARGGDRAARDATCGARSASWSPPARRVRRLRRPARRHRDRVAEPSAVARTRPAAPDAGRCSRPTVARGRRTRRVETQRLGAAAPLRRRVPPPARARAERRAVARAGARVPPPRGARRDPRRPLRRRHVGRTVRAARAVERLREVRRTAPDGRLVTISAADPLNLAGILTAGERVRAIADATASSTATACRWRRWKATTFAAGRDRCRDRRRRRHALAGRRVPAVLSGYVGRTGYGTSGLRGLAKQSDAFMFMYCSLLMNMIILRTWPRPAIAPDLYLAQARSSEVDA